MMARVAVLRTTPQTVLDDYERLMHLAGYREALPAGVATLLKINISWQVYYPACSTAPWQLEGVIRTLLRDGRQPSELLGVHNRTVVVDDRVGEVNNKHKIVTDHYRIPTVHLNEPGIAWLRYEPKAPLLVLDRVYPDGIHIPQLLMGTNIIHLPTAKTHVFTTMTGAMKNAFGGLLHERRHWTHAVIHETLVDLLTIQKEIHTGIFAVMDGTLAGDGPGPRAMRPHVKNIILASADQVAIDAIAARMMGFDPLSIRFIRLAHERGLGVGDPREIEVVGDDISRENWRFEAHQNTLASRGQKLIYWGPLKPLEHFLLRTAIAPWSYLASRLYHDVYWYPFVGKPRVRAALRTPWGQLFQRYEQELAGRELPEPAVRA
jgi:uncharacterized protein (DUF362 family)